MPSYYFERVLFIVGEQNSGKSTQLRSMFRDVHLGTDENIPPASNLKEMYRLSNERCLYIRLSSPHERGEYFGRRPDDEADNFLDKTEEKKLQTLLTLEESGILLVRYNPMRRSTCLMWWRPSGRS